MKSAFLSFSLLLIGVFSYSQTIQEIAGRVTQMGQPLANANVLVKESGNGTTTDSLGRYKIEAIPGNSLQFSFTGLNTMEVIIEDVTHILNIEMEQKVEQLDEVTVSKTLATQELLAKNYRLDKNIIKTTFRYVDTRSVSSRVSIIDKEKLSKSSSSDFANAVEGWFIGRIDRSDPLNPRFFDLRGARSFLGGTASMIFDVDGQIFDVFPFHINVIDNIERVAFIGGQWAVGSYGMRAAGGVIVVNTKGSNMVFETDSKTVYDYERLRNNFYVDDTTKISTSAHPNYLEELLEATSGRAALEIYQNQNAIQKSSPYYHLNISDYFLKTWNNKKISLDILDKVALDFSLNPVVLKAVAYQYDALGEWEKSNNLYKKVLRLRPKYAQSYRDVANSYRQLGEYASALNLYARYPRAKQLDSTFMSVTSIDSIIETEYKNVVLLHGNQVFKNNRFKKKAHDVWGERILVEWNHGEAEFELQVVHPNTQFFKIDHTLLGNPKRIASEKIKGYSSEEIWIGKNDIGTWNINLMYLGNKSFDPTYFKVTLYRNWGLPSQIEVVKIYRLDEKNMKKNILRFTIAGNDTR